MEWQELNLHPNRHSIRSTTGKEAQLRTTE